MLSQSSRGPSQPHGSCRNSPLGSAGLSCGAGVGAGRAESQEQKLGGRLKLSGFAAPGSLSLKISSKYPQKHPQNAFYCTLPCWPLAQRTPEAAGGPPEGSQPPPSMWVTLPARGLAAFWGPGGDSGSHRCLSRGGGRWVKGPCGFSPPPGSRHQPGPGCARRTKGAPGCLTPANILGPSLFTAARASTKPRIVSSGAPRAPESVSAFCKGGRKGGGRFYLILFFF